MSSDVTPYEPLPSSVKVEPILPTYGPPAHAYGRSSEPSMIWAISAAAWLGALGCTPPFVRPAMSRTCASAASPTSTKCVSTGSIDSERCTMSSAVRPVCGSGDSGGASASTIASFFTPGRQLRSNARLMPENIVSGQSPPSPRLRPWIAVLIVVALLVKS